MGKKSSSKLGHVVLEEAYSLLLSRMVVRYSVVLRQLGADRNEEVRFGRFINNTKITPERLLDHHSSQSNIDFAGKHILAINDTSTLSFAAHEDRTDLGYVSQNTNKRGFDIHPTILVDAQENACYRLGGLSIFKNDKALQERSKEEKEDKKSKDYYKTPFEEKERYKWFKSPAQAIKNYPGAATYTLVGDREADIYELMAKTLNQGWEFVYRSSADRSLYPRERGKTLRPAIDKWRVQHTYELDIPRTRKRTAHKAILDLKFGELSMSRPQGHKDKQLPDHLCLRVVEVKEKASTVVGDEKPIHWIILTSHPVESVEQAMQIILWYRWRWTIEQVFRTLKSKGLNVENSAAETFHGLANLAVLTLIAAIQVMQLVQARQGDNSQKLEDAFFSQEQQCLKALNKKLEGKTKKLKNPHPPDSLAFGSWVIARLGSWSGYKSQKPPGPITMIRGLTRFYDILEGYYLML